jgi:hypothetical protein
VPVHLAATHQAGALALWTSALYTLHSVQRAIRPAPGILFKVLTNNGQATKPAAAAVATGAAAAAAMVGLRTREEE